MLTERYDHAITLTRQLHGQMIRKGDGTPYVNHLLQVSGIVLEMGGTETEAIAALLHDAAEDAGGEVALEQIAASMGIEVAQIVRECSDCVADTKDNKRPWKERKDAYLECISHKSESACLVSLADKIQNVRCLESDQRRLGPSHWDRFNATQEQSLWYYGDLIARMVSRVDEFPRLSRAVEELGACFARLEQMVEG
jgi:(p)ppGpp synthase/HD superfamily hydrolase